MNDFEKIYFQTLEDGIEKLPEDMRGIVFRSCAVNCAKNYVYTELKRQFDECGGSLDEQYEKYGHSEYFFAEIIEPGHVYEMGFPKCFCPFVGSGMAVNPIHCECSRQSILFVLQELLPDNKIKAEILKTVLGGGDHCRFRVEVLP